MSTTADLRRAAAALLLAVWAMGFAGVARAQLMQIDPAGEAQVLSDPATPFAGAPDADVTVVEYLDYNCPYCRKMAETLGRLVQSDARVRVLYKDWPIFGGVSAYAARAALAAQWQGKYLAAHDALIGAPARLTTQAQVRERLASAGVDLARLDRDLAAHLGAVQDTLARNNAEARALGFTGTPGLLVGPLVLPGNVGLEDMHTLINAARENAAREARGKRAPGRPS